MPSVRYRSKREGALQACLIQLIDTGFTTKTAMGSRDLDGLQVKPDEHPATFPSSDELSNCPTRLTTQRALSDRSGIPRLLDGRSPLGRARSISFEVRMPQFGLTMDEGPISNWLRTEGDSVEAGDVLYDVETDKLTNEVASECAGVLRAIVAPVGEDVPVLGLLALIGSADEPLVMPDETAPTAPTATSSTERVSSRTAIVTTATAWARSPPFPPTSTGQHKRKRSAPRNEYQTFATNP